MINKISIKSLSLCLFVTIIPVFIIWYCSFNSNNLNAKDHSSHKVDLAKYSINKIPKDTPLAPILVIGSGPAGYAAGLYGARADVYTVVMEGYQPGGLLTTTSYVENWPGIIRALGKNIMEQAKKQAEGFGAVMAPFSITKVDFSSWPYKVWTAEGRQINALSIIIATGARTKELGVKGEKEYWSKGVTACAVCDAPGFKGKNVVVCGGGDSAIEEATYLSSFAKTVTVAVRSNKLRAAAAMQNRLPEYKNVKVLYNTSVNAILGDGNEVKSVDFIDNTTKKITNVPMDGVFMAIGHQPNSDIFKGQLEIDDLGYIVINPLTQETNKFGIFSAGDVSDKFYKQAGVAAGDGIKAALGAGAFLRDIGFNKAVSQQFSADLYKNEESKKIEIKEIKSLTSLSELEKLIKAEKALVVDCYGTWCPPCKRMMPIVEEASVKLSGKVTIIKVDVDKAPEISKKYKIKSLPYFMVFKNGKMVASQAGAMFEKGQFENFARKSL